MAMTTRLAGLLLFSTALTAPQLAFAQSADPLEDEQAGEQAGEQAAEPDDDGLGVEDPDGLGSDEQPVEEADVSIPGTTVVITGRRNQDVTRSASQVVTVLTQEEIARTGEGDIAGALGRTTGLSVQGNGFVFVRGLGDRYSLALLNGLPLPSPQPLSRVVPLDIFSHQYRRLVAGAENLFGQFPR